MTEYKSSAREHLVALKIKGAKECFVKEIINGPTMKHKAYANLAFSDKHTETVDELSVEGIITFKKRYFKKEMRTIPKVHALRSIPYVTTELKLRLA